MASKHLLSAGLILSAGILAGRLAGLVRESVLAAQFGVGASADAAALIVTLPDLFANLLAGGAISAVLIPELVRQGEPQARLLFRRVLATALVVFLGLTVAFQLAPGALVRVLAPGFSAPAAAAAATGVGIALWAIIPTVLAGIVTAYLNAREHFAVPAFGTLIYNVTVVAVLLTAGAGAAPLGILGGAIAAGALFRLASQTAVLPKGTLTGPGWAGPLPAALTEHYTRALLAGMLPVLLPAIVRAIASLEGLGGMAMINYATKLVELPLGICISVLSAVLLPRMAGLSRDPGRRAESNALLQTGISGALALSYATLLPLAWFNLPAATLVYGRGEMLPADLQAIGLLAAIGFASLPAQGVSSLLTASFNARQDTTTPLYVNGAGLAITAALALLAAKFGDLRALMLAVVAGYYLIALAQLLTLKFRHGVALRPALLNAANLRGLGAALAVFAVFAALDRWLRPAGWPALVLGGLAGLVMLAATVFVTPALRRLAARDTAA